MTLLPALMISLSATFCTFTAPNAEAGIILSTDSDPQIRRIGSLITTVGFVVLIVGAVQGHAGSMVSGLTLMVLDSEGNLPQKQIEKLLSTRFPFIDNGSVIQNLAQEISIKFKNQNMNESTMLVSLTPEETLAIISPAYLDNEQMGKVVNDLK